MPRTIADFLQVCSVRKPATITMAAPNMIAASATLKIPVRSEPAPML